MMRLKKALLIVILLTAVSCSDNSVTGNDPEEVVAVVKAPSTATVGSEVTLDGSDSTGPIIAYGWLMVSQPENSASRINNSESEEANFTPDVEGEYVIRLNVISDQVLADSDDVTVTASGNN